MLALQLQQLGPHLLVPAHIWGGCRGSQEAPRCPLCQLQTVPMLTKGCLIQQGLRIQVSAMCYQQLH